MLTGGRGSRARGASGLYLGAGGPAGMNRPAGNGCPGFRPGLPAAPSRGIKEPRRVAAHRRRKPLEPRMTEIRSEEHTSELQSLMRISYAVFCLKKKKIIILKKHKKTKEMSTLQHQYYS